MSLFSRVSNAVGSATKKVTNAAASVINKAADKVYSAATSSRLVNPSYRDPYNAAKTAAAKGVVNAISAGSKNKLNLLMNKKEFGGSGNGGGSWGGTTLMNVLSNPSRSTASGGTGGGTLFPRVNVVPTPGGDLPLVRDFSSGLNSSVLGGAMARSQGPNQTANSGVYDIAGGQSLIPGSLGPTSRTAGTATIPGLADLSYANNEDRAKALTGGKGIFGDTRIGRLFSGLGTLGNAVVGGAKTLAGANVDMLKAGGAQAARLFTESGSARDQALSNYSNAAWNRAMSPFQQMVRFNAPEVPVTNDAGSLMEPPPKVPSGPSPADLDAQARTYADDAYSMNTRMNPAGGGYIDTDNLTGGEVYTLLNNETGATSMVTKAQYDANPEYWDQIFSTGEWSMQDPNAVPETAIPGEDVLANQDVAAPSGTESLDALYKKLQEASGIPAIIAEIKDLQNQQLAARSAIDKLSEEIVSDPDYSMGSKERRLAFLTGQSAAGVAYRDTTARLEALGALLQQANQEIQQRMGLYAPAIQAAFQPKQAGDDYTIQDGYLLNKQTGKYEKIDGSNPQSLKPEERYKLLAQQQWKQNYDVSRDQLGFISSTVKSAAGSGFDLFDGNTYDSVNWSSLAKNGAKVDTLVTAAYRMTRPDLTRISADGTIVDSQSLIGGISQKLSELANDADGAPDKIRDLVEQAMRVYSSTQSSYQRNLQDFNAKFPEGGANPLGLTPPGGESNSDFGW